MDETKKRNIIVSVVVVAVVIAMGSVYMTMSNNSGHQIGPTVPNPYGNKSPKQMAVQGDMGAASKTGSPVNNVNAAGMNTE